MNELDTRLVGSQSVILSEVDKSRRDTAYHLVKLVTIEGL